jgi:hypothetical protein
VTDTLFIVLAWLLFLCGALAAAGVICLLAYAIVTAHGILRDSRGGFQTRPYWRWRDLP